MTGPSWLRAPGRGRYARVEHELRFVLAEVPADARSPRVVDDLYVDGSTLRLRRVTDGETVVHKLTQKVRFVADDPSAVALTNIYLDAAEHERLAALPGRWLRKTRREWHLDGRVWAVDEFEDAWRGLVLAELETDEPATVDVRRPLCADVTTDDRFSGGALARADDSVVEAVMSFVRALVGRP